MNPGGNDTSLLVESRRGVVDQIAGVASSIASPQEERNEEEEGNFSEQEATNMMYVKGALLSLVIGIFSFSCIGCIGNLREDSTLSRRKRGKFIVGCSAGLHLSVMLGVCISYILFVTGIFGP